MRYNPTSARLPKFRATFFRTGAGGEPVRDWLLSLPKEDRRIARVLFAVSGQEIVLLHGFIKKTQRTLTDDIKLAEKRWKEWQRGDTEQASR